jgi:hypothetical protein
MSPETLEDRLTQDQRKLFASLTSPSKIQTFLDATPYSPEDTDRCPLRVIQDRLAHCLDGGLFAAAALRRIGFPPLVVDIFPDPGMDDDHVLAIFKRNGHYGAVAKSNYAGLRFREPIYRTLRELVLSYFNDFYNFYGVKSLRSYTRPLNLRTMDRFNWEWDDKGAVAIEYRLKELHTTRLMTAEMAQELNLIDEIGYKAGMIITNIDGVYKPKIK